MGALIANSGLETTTNHEKTHTSHSSHRFVRASPDLLRLDRNDDDNHFHFTRIGDDERHGHRRDGHQCHRHDYARRRCVGFHDDDRPRRNVIRPPAEVMKGTREACPFFIASVY